MTLKQFLLKENNNLDIIRIVCAALVIVEHCYDLSPKTIGMDPVKFLTGFSTSGLIAVKAFFFISGMLVTESLMKKQSTKSFLISRVFRMMPALIFVILITALIIGPWVTTLTLPQYFKSKVLYSFIFKNCYFSNAYCLPGVFMDNHFWGVVNGSLWTLQYEARFYIILLCVFLVCKYTIKKYRLISLILTILIFIDAFFDLQIIGKGASIKSLLPMSFALGCFLAVNSSYFVINYKTVLVSAILMAIFWRTNKVNEILFNITVCLAIIPISQLNILKKIKIKYDISYGIYVWGFTVQQVLVYFKLYNNFYLFFIYSMVITWVMGFISFVTVEKRCIDYGRKLDKRIGKIKTDTIK